MVIPKFSDNYCKYLLRLSLRGRFRPWQSLQKRRDCGACSEYSEESCSGLLRLRLATSLAMTILIAGFKNLSASLKTPSLSSTPLHHSRHTSSCMPRQLHKDSPLLH